jgi:hypothetical protein
MNYYLLFALTLVLKDESIAKLFHRSWRVGNFHHIL